MIKYADNSIVSNPGSPIHVIYGPKVVSKEGNIELVEIGKENIHDYIQSQKESTDMSYILSRMAAGDTSMLRTDGMYGDFTQIPNTLADVLQLQIDSNRMFASLPAEVKEKFHFDANEFFAQSGQMDWYEKIKPVLSDEVKNQIWPVENDEKGDVTE